jgi:hypothetical protein
MRSHTRLFSRHAGRQIPTVAFALAAVAPVVTNAIASSVVIPDDFPTIQAALDSPSADTIVVRPGEYRETPRISDRSVVLRGESLDPGVRPTLDGRLTG